MAKKKYYHGSQLKRMERINKVFDYIEKKEPISIEMILSRFSHISRRTITDYIKVLVNQGKIKTNTYGEFVVL